MVLREVGLLMRFASAERTITVDTQEARVRRMQRRIGAWADAWIGIEGVYLVMVTLTYRVGVQWRARHVSDFFRKVRMGMGRDVLSYAWVAELQKRGVPHYHVLFVVKQGRMLPKPDSAGWWPHGMTNIGVAESPYYVVKYASKCEEWAKFPKGLRLFGIGIGKYSEQWLGNRRWRVLLTAVPSYVAARVGLDFKAWWKRVDGGYLVAYEGEWLDFIESPWHCLGEAKEQKRCVS